MSMQNQQIRPKISIGMPVYNNEIFIKKAINSLLDQTFVDFELIISDNASTDKTNDICMEYASKDRRIRHFRQDQNNGAKANFNFVLKEASAALFMWAASDELWDREYLKTLYTAIIADDSFGAAFSPYVYIDTSDKAFRKMRAFDYSNQSALIRLIKFCYYYDDVWIYALFNTKLLKEVHFPTWWGINSITPLNTAYPALIQILSSKNFTLAGSRPLFYNRVQNRHEVRHSIPFKKFLPMIYVAFVFRKFNVFCESLISVYKGSRSLLLTLAILPFFFLRFLIDCIIPQRFPIKKIHYILTGKK